MPSANPLLRSPPYAVEQSIRALGVALRRARVRRNLTVAAVAEKIGTGVRAVMDAEKGKPSTSIAVYVALLWTFDLLGPFDTLADPHTDAEGEALAAAREPTKARRRRHLDNEF